ncbi:glycosyltransferase family 8 protein [Paracoccus jeotgali]|nr:glycosyltransferase family 8 protein [Paracoccus jeotgali]
MSKVHIVTGSDDNYAAGVMGLIASAAAHIPDLRVTVLDREISPDNRARIDALGPRLNIDVQRIEIAADALADLPVLRGHLTSATYLRLLIPELLPDEDRVLYMDCDMVVTGNLTDIACMEMGDAPVAAVPCPSPMAAELSATELAKGQYVNAGLLVMNLPICRREDMAGACLRLLADPAKPLLSEDQSALNMACRGRIILLPPEYNVYSDPAAWSDPSLIPAEPKVIHYVVGMKPWNGPVPLGAVWSAYVAPIADLMPQLKPTRRRRRLSRLNGQRKMVLGLLTGRRKYLNKFQAQRRMAELSRELSARV